MSSQYREGLGRPTRNVPKDARISICEDRGDADYNTDNPIYLSCDISAPGIEQLANIDGVRACLHDATVRVPPDSNKHYFIPRPRLHTIMIPEQALFVICQLGCCQQLTAKEKKEFCEKLYSPENPSWKVLAALLASGKEEELYQLVHREGMSDACLPITADSGSPCRIPHHKHQTVNSWPTFPTLCEVSQWSYAVKTVYFKDAADGHNHYVLDGNDVLPTPRSGVLPGGNKGAFGNVGEVSFAHGHYHTDHLAEWQSGLKMKPPQRFAIKRLVNSPNLLRNFNRELVSLLHYKQQGHRHLIPLLATFEIQRGPEARTPLEYGFIFPIARGDLTDFWQQNHEKHNLYGPWMFNQFYQLAHALMQLHANPEYQSHSISANTGGKLYARHGDIKPDNILWFGAQGDDMKSERLVFADFGLGRLHTKASRSTSLYEGGGYRQRRKVPEDGLKTGIMSRAMDVFSLGRTYLEFITWFMEGYHEDGFSRYFPKKKNGETGNSDESGNSDDSMSGKSAVFDEPEDEVEDEAGDETESELSGYYEKHMFYVIKKTRAGEYKLVVNPDVLTWINTLINKTDDSDTCTCSGQIRTLLYLIRDHMLQPDRTKRIKMADLVPKLLELAEAARSPPCSGGLTEPSGSNP